MKQLFLLLSLLLSINIQAKESLLIYRNGTETLVDSGELKVIDGDTFKIGKSKVRLIGVDAPEIGQKCKFEKEYFDCGEATKKEVEILTTSQKVVCEILGKDLYKRYLVECRTDNKNINTWLLENGFAVYYYNSKVKHYEDYELVARENYEGIWLTEFQKPKDYRKSKKNRKK